MNISVAWNFPQIERNGTYFVLMIENGYYFPVNPYATQEFGYLRRVVKIGTCCGEKRVVFSYKTVI